MQPEQIDHFFKLLDKKLNQAADIIIIGAAAGSLMGHIRPSIDIDFEIRFRGNAGYDAIDLASVMKELTDETHIAAQYSDNVEHWSMINFLDYRETAIPYKQIGQLNIKLIAPPYWTIGKIARYLDPDISDMIAIIKKKNISLETILSIWKRARDSSGLSIEVGQFQTHAVEFLESHGKQVWGSGFNPDVAVDEFKQRM